MITKQTQSFTYNGLSFTSKPIPKRKQPRVALVGIRTPIDPGFVTVINIETGKLEQLPTFALEKCPIFDFEAMLSTTQKKHREKAGMLFGAGSSEKPGFIPLADCKIRKEVKK